MGISTLFNLGPSRTIPIQFKRKLSHRTVPIMIDGHQFTARRVFVESTLAKKLKINPALLRKYLKILFLKPNSYARFCKLMDYSTSVEAFYPLAKKGDQAKFFAGERERILIPSRNIVLPEGPVPARTLAHEILHDIFMGGGLTAKQTKSFARNVLFWAFNALNNPDRLGEATFYRLIANNCFEKTDLAVITGGLLSKVFESGKTPGELMFFVGECFAYAGELYLGYSTEEELGKLPFEIGMFFDRIKLAA